MPATTTWQHHRARLAYLSCATPDDRDSLAAERAALLVRKLEADVRRRVATGPQLTQEQAAQLAALLIDAALDPTPSGAR